MKGQRSAPPRYLPSWRGSHDPVSGGSGVRQRERQLSDESERDRPARTFHPRLCAAPLSARRHTPPPIPPPFSFHSPTFFPNPPKPNSASQFHSASRADRGSSLQDGTSSVQHHELTRAPTHTHGHIWNTLRGGGGRLLARSGCCQSCSNFWGTLSWGGFFTLLFPGCCRHTSVTSLDSVSGFHTCGHD